MNNFWFYWAMWIFWLTVAFFFKKGKEKTVVLVLLLLIITLAPFTVSLGSVRLNEAFVLLGLTGCGLLSQLRFYKVLKLSIASSIIMLLNVLGQIYWLYDPAILLVLPKWTFILFMGFLILTLSTSFWQRLAILLIGMSQGEILQSLVFYPYDNTIGDTDYLVTMSFLMLLVSVYEIMNRGAAILRTASLTRTGKRLEK